MCEKQPMTPWRGFAGISYHVVLMFALLTLQAIGAKTASATHFPPGALCYDCHAVKKEKMVPGSHLIKKSWRTAELGYDNGASTPCLFCHDWNATVVGNNPSLDSNGDNVPDTVVMKGVSDHFSSLSRSKHRVYLKTRLAGPVALSATFDCIDCHDKITATVDSGTNLATPTVHGGKNPSLAALPVKDTLRGFPSGQPYTDANLSLYVCKDSGCHGGAADNLFEIGRISRKVHAVAKARINGAVAAPTACPECHGKHNSFFSEKLLVLKLDGTTSNDPNDDLLTFVAPKDCESCHDQDDGGVFEASGHGQPTLNPAPLKCLNCHDFSVPHSFVSPPSANTYRFALAEGTEVSKLTQKNASSICTNCHQKYTLLHSNSNMKVGCIDCHEPHGKGVGINIKMVRQQIPADYTDDGSGVLMAADQGVDDNISYASRDDFYRADGFGVCDNDDCHGGVIFSSIGKTVSINPLNVYMGSNEHSGGDLPDPSISPFTKTDCTGCHAHIDTAGLWKASAACDKCHGQPPSSSANAAPGYATAGGFDEAKTPHYKHAGEYSLHCTACHLNYNNGAWHNTGGLSIGPPQIWADDTKISYQSVYFDPARNPSADQVGTTLPPYDPPFDHSTSYDAANNQCSDLYCHSDGQRSTSTNNSNPTPLIWSDAGNWGVNDLACNSCHGAGNGTAGTTYYGAPDHANGGTETPNSHPAHGAFACAVCHYATTTDTNAADGWTITGTSSHVNGEKTLYAMGKVVAGQPNFDPVGTTPPTCQNITCHGGNTATWGSMNLPCQDCHLRTAINGGDANDFVFGNAITAAVNQEQWLTTGHGRPTNEDYDTYPEDTDPNAGAGFASCTDNCHTAAIPHNSPNNFFRLRTVGMATPNFNNTNTDPQEDIAVCLDCHSSTGAASGSSVLHVEENHFGTKHQGHQNYGGSFCWDCHDPHGDGNPFMIHGDSLTPNSPTPGDGVTDQSDGVFGKPVTSRPVRDLNLADGYTSDDLVRPSKDGLCQTCHGLASTPVNYFTRAGAYTSPADHNGANGTRCTNCHLHSDDFKPQGCDECHGYPPVQDQGGSYCSDLVTARASATVFTPQCENYPGGGGAHLQHLAMIRSKLGSGEQEAVKAVCGPCHGENTMSKHAQAIKGVPIANINAQWPAGVRGFVNIRARAQNSWDGSPVNAKYNGVAVVVDGNATGDGSGYSATGDDTNRCEGVDCHGNPIAAEGLSWSNDVSDDAGDDEDAEVRSRVCEGCHDESPAQVRIYDLGGTAIYTGNAPDAAANYFGTLSGYGRGGHGDAEIQNEDPLVDSAAGVSTPIDCTACHDASTDHFPELAANIHRLIDPDKIETTAHSSGASGDICNRCHDGADYPGKHHPSFYGPTMNNATPHDVVPVVPQEILSPVNSSTTWDLLEIDPGVFSLPYVQNAYGAANYSGNPDGFINWWGGSYGSGNQDPPPKPVFYGEGQGSTVSPKAILPLEQYILNKGTSNRVMCVTCHNPHGSDLFVYDDPANHGSVSMAKKLHDNNMLRLLDKNNALCQACH